MVSVILESVNFVKNDILKCEYLEKCEFEHVNFWVVLRCSAELCRAAPSPIQNNNKLFTFRSILCFEIGNISFIELNIINPST